MPRFSSACKMMKWNATLLQCWKETWMDNELVSHTGEWANSHTPQGSSISLHCSLMMKHPSPLYRDSKRIMRHIHWASTRRQALIQRLWCFNSLGPHSHSLRYMLLWCPYYRWENRPREHCFQQLHSLYVAAPGLKPGILASEPVFIITNILPPLKYHA